MNPSWVFARILRALVLVLAIGTAGPAWAADSSAEEMLKKSADIARRFLTIQQWEGVRNIMGAARAIYIAPEIKSGSLIIGYEGGGGVLLRRHGEEWSDPAFLDVSRLSVGLQAGVRESDLLLLVMTDRAIDDFISGVSKVSGSGGFALGDLGVQGSAAGGASGGLEILVLGTSRGLALGSGIERMTMSNDRSENEKAYGGGVRVDQVLAAPGSRLAAAADLRSTLKEAVQKSRTTK